MNAITRIAPRQIATTREAHTLASLDSGWSIVARQCLTMPAGTLEWVWNGNFADRDFAAFRHARNNGLIATCQGRDSGGNCVLYAKTSQYIPRLQKYAYRALTR